MSKEHFNVGSGEGRDIGLIPPSAGPEPDVMPLDRTRSKKTSVFKTQEEMETSGTTQAEETVEEREVPSGGRTKSARPQRTVRGSAQATMGTKAVASNLSYLHTSYSTIVNNARSIRRLSDTDHAALDYAQSKLNDAAASHHKASAEGGLGERNMDRDVAHSHLQDMAASLRTVHKTLKTSGVADRLSQHNLHAAMPQDNHIVEAVQHANNLPRQGRFGEAGATKPFREVKMGRGNIPGTAIDEETVKKAEQEMGKESYAVRKLKMGKGTPRGKSAGIATGAEINPKRRGSGRRIDTRFSSDANKVGSTPKFGEPGKSGTIKGYIEQPKKRDEGVKKGIEQQTPNPQAQEATKAIRERPSGKPGPGKYAENIDKARISSLIRERNKRRGGRGGAV